MRKKIYFALGILFVISISIFIFNSIYQGVIPKIVEEINNSSIGAILTAIITVLLLSQQSSSEEVKEKNVKVFEKKSEVFNKFIEQLWSIWEDRSVSLEELNNLLKSVSKDIIPYAKSENSLAILIELNKIASKTNSIASDSSDINVTNQIQQSVFEIINVLSKEIGLGGEIKGNILNELNLLEKKILPYLTKRNNINLIRELVNTKSNGILDEFEYDTDDILWWKIGNSGVWLRVGDVRKEGLIYITFWSEFYENRQYQSYRYRQKGDDKDWFNGYEKIENLFDFNDLRNGVQVSNEKMDILTNRIVNFYKQTTIDDKTIEEIIEEFDKTLEK